MNKQKLSVAVITEESVSYTIIEVSEQLAIPAELIEEMKEQGLFITDKQLIDQHSLNRIVSACRLNRDLGVNLPGAVLALELLDELNELRHRLAIIERMKEQDESC
jgi:chaperone modulatory protein CbpM